MVSQPRKWLCSAAYLSSLTVTVSAAAQAQTESTAQTQAQESNESASRSPSSRSGNDGLVDIVVTATKRSESLQDVPVSVTAVTQDVLERQNVRELDDVTKLVPGLTITYGSQPGNFSINMRGIGTFSNGIATESDVAIVIDDVPIGFQAAAFKDLIDVERIEALKGPQSTLFGKSAIAGVLNITTQAPTDELSGRATALTTNDNEWRIGGTFSGPLSDTLSFRVTAARNVFDGIVENITTGENVNGSKGSTVTGKLRWQPSDKFSMTFQPRFNSTHATCCVSPINSLSPGLYFQGARQLPESEVLAGIPFNDPYNVKVRNDSRAGGDSRSYGSALHASYELDPTSFLNAETITYIGSFDRYRMADYQDIDGSDQPFLLYWPVAAPANINSGAKIRGLFHANSVTQELRLTSPGDEKFGYVAGLWYAHNELDRFLDRGPVLQFIRYLAASQNTNYSFFTDMSYDIAPKLTLIGGFRVNRQEIEYEFDNYTAAVPFHLAGDDADNAFTGKAGVQYRLTPDNMIYATYSTGYKGQAYDLVSTFNARIAQGMPVPPETAKNYEIGMKNSLFDRHLFLNGTLFWANYFGFQTSVTSFLPDGTFLTFLNSVGQLRTRGLELDFLGKVSNRLSFNGAAAFMDAEIVDFPFGPCYGGQTLAQGCFLDPRTTTNPGRVQNLAGKRLNNAPEFKFNVGSEYEFPLGGAGMGAFVSANYRWQSKINFALSQDPITERPAFGVFDAKIGLSAEDDRYKLAFFVNNLFDKHYGVGIGNTTSGFSAPGVTGFGTNWQPARDAFRYMGLRLDASF